MVALPTQAAYRAANGFLDSFSRHRRSNGPPACTLAFGLTTEVGVGQRDGTRTMIQHDQLHGIGEYVFLSLLDAGFLGQPRSAATRRHYDPLGEAQITARLGPSKLAKVAKRYTRAEKPLWQSDTKFLRVGRALSKSSMVLVV